MVIPLSEIDLKSIKLIIWDLDNTLWNGVLSEGDVVVDDKAASFLKESSRRGIVNSICSKNTFADAELELKSLGLWDLFVFPSLDWTPKRERLFGIIKEMGLRPANVLFLDDEPYNLAAASSYDDSLICSSMDDSILLLFDQMASMPIDESYKRLGQYKDLQKKNNAKLSFNNDQEFLESSGICVRIGKDCYDHKDRIFELINRTNQLNYTKIRLGAEQVDELLGDKRYDCGYVEVKDVFCDYGIVGFFAKKGKHLDHFLFSCRTIGMGIEQFVYATLGFPTLNVLGEVVTALKMEGKPGWIKIVSSFEHVDKNVNSDNIRILLKGPCDVSQVLPFFKDSTLFDTEFSYVSKEKHMYIEAQNHLSQVFLSTDADDETKKGLIKTLPFIDRDYFDTKVLSGQYDIIILSLLPNYGLGLYKNIHEEGLIVPFNQYTFDFTEHANWVDIMHQQCDWPDSAIYSAYNYFKENYEFIGRESDEDLIAGLTRLRSLIPESTYLLLVNGAEYEFVGTVKQGYEQRHVLHRHLNSIVESFAAQYDNVSILDVNDCINGSEDYLDTINHYKKVVYYRMALAIQSLISDKFSSDSIDVRNRFAVFYDTILGYFSKLKGKVYMFYSRYKASTNNDKRV